MANEYYQARNGWKAIVQKIASESSGRVSGSAIRDVLHKAGDLEWGSLKSMVKKSQPKCVGVRNQDRVFYAKPVSDDDCSNCFFVQLSGNVVTCELKMKRNQNTGVDTAPGADQLDYAPSSGLRSQVLGRFSGSRLG